MERSALIEGNYRYLLRIPTDLTGGKKALFVLCNPSTADSTKDDMTTRNIKKWSAQNGISEIIIANLYAFRTPHRHVLFSMNEADAIGEKNIKTIQKTLAEVNEVIVGWGNPIKSKKWSNEFSKHTEAVLKILRKNHSSLYSVGRTKAGNPRHPRVWFMTKKCEKELYSTESNP